MERGRKRSSALTAAYGAFARGGIVRDPVMNPARRRCRGQCPLQRSRQIAPAVTEATAFLMSSMLADVVNSGDRLSAPARPASSCRRRERPARPTTNVDAWFVGFTPHIVTGVWIGFDQPSPIVAGGYAGELAVSRLDGVHEDRDEGRQARLVRPSPNVVGNSTSAGFPASSRTRAAGVSSHGQ